MLKTWTSRLVLRIRIIITFGVCAILTTVAIFARIDVQSQPMIPTYKNPRLSIEDRLADLLGRMTLEEKVAQLICLYAERPQAAVSTGRGNFSEEKARQVMKYGIGQIARLGEDKGPRDGAILANTVQKWLIENTRLGIPAIIHDEILHGHMAPGSTSFPQPIALASSWDPDFISNVFTAVALETRARGSHQGLGPNLDLGREPRWGRTEETYGEDPYLVARMAVAVISALQGKGPGIDGVQLYIHDLVSSVTRPVMELKDFIRISLAPGESKTVEFMITPDKLSFLDLNMRRIVEPGRFDVLVGSSSVEYRTVKLEVAAN